MDELLREVLDLQRVWQAGRNDAMDRRGHLVRTEIRNWLERYTDDLAGAMGVAFDDVEISGSDGIGNKAHIVWTGVFSKDNSASPTTGWYIVYLFGGDGERVYLSLIQATTEWTGGDLRARKLADLSRRGDWAREQISQVAAERPGLKETIDLKARTALGKSYEQGTVLSVEYRREAIPGPDLLRQDLLFMARLLGQVYEAAKSAPYIPGDVPPEVREVTKSADEAAARGTVHGTGQGFLLTVDERRAIEKRSVRLATEYFEDQGWQVEDVGAEKSYDLDLTRGDEKLYVEVKGTTSDGSQVVLTRREVEVQREFAPNNALVVVHSIGLDRSTDPVTATGGVVHCTSPWEIEDDSLTVVSFIHRTGL